MVNKTTGAELIKSISFEVEAIPQDNVVELKNIGNLTPLNVKVRVRKKDDGPALVKKGIISIPRYDQPDIPVERLRLASSDQTIMSFNMLMEADLERKASKKQKMNFFGICLGKKRESDEDQYLPTSSTADAEDVISASETGIVKLRRNPGATDDSKYAHTKKDKFFGKCKPGGCLDPPFGEEKYAYQPQHQNLRALKSPAIRTINPEEIETIDMHGFRVPDASNIKKKEGTSKVSNKEDEKNSSVLSLYQGEPKSALEDNDSDSIITYPPALSSSGLLLGDEKAEKNVARRTSAPRQSRKSFNEFSASYFSPPRTSKDSRDSKERAKSYSTKDIKDVKRDVSRSPKRVSNSTIRMGVFDQNKNTTDTHKNADKSEWISLGVATAGLTGTGIAMALVDKQDVQEQKHKLSKLEDANKILIDDLNTHGNFISPSSDNKPKLGPDPLVESLFIEHDIIVDSKDLKDHQKQPQLIDTADIVDNHNTGGYPTDKKFDQVISAPPTDQKKYILRTGPETEDINSAQISSEDKIPKTGIKMLRTDQNGEFQIDYEEFNAGSQGHLPVIEHDPFDEKIAAPNVTENNISVTSTEKSNVIDNNNITSEEIQPESVIITPMKQTVQKDTPPITGHETSDTEKTIMDLGSSQRELDSVTKLASQEHTDWTPKYMNGYVDAEKYTNLDANQRQHSPIKQNDNLDGEKAIYLKQPDGSPKTDYIRFDGMENYQDAETKQETISPFLDGINTHDTPLGLQLGRRDSSPIRGNERPEDMVTYFESQKNNPPITQVQSREYQTQRMEKNKNLSPRDNPPTRCDELGQKVQSPSGYGISDDEKRLVLETRKSDKSPTKANSSDSNAMQRDTLPGRKDYDSDKGLNTQQRVIDQSPKGEYNKSDDMDISSEFGANQREKSPVRSDQGLNEHYKSLGVRTSERDGSTDRLYELEQSSVVDSSRKTSPVRRYPDRYDIPSGLDAGRRNTSPVIGSIELDNRYKIIGSKSGENDGSMRKYNTSYDIIRSSSISENQRPSILLASSVMREENEVNDNYTTLGFQSGEVNESPTSGFVRSYDMERKSGLDVSERDMSPLRAKNGSEGHNTALAFQSGLSSGSPQRGYDKSSGFDEQQTDKPPDTKYHENLSSQLEQRVSDVTPRRYEISNSSNSRDRSPDKEHITFYDKDSSLGSQQGFKGKPQINAGQNDQTNIRSSLSGSPFRSRDTSPTKAPYNISILGSHKSISTRDTFVKSDIVKNAEDITTNYQEDVMKNKLEAMKIPDETKEKGQYVKSGTYVPSNITTSALPHGKPSIGNRLFDDHNASSGIMGLKPSRKELEEIHGYGGKYTSQSDVSTMDISRKGQAADKLFTSRDSFGNVDGYNSSVTVKPSGQARDSIFLNLAFQTSLDENQTTVKTLDSEKDTNQDNVFVVKSLIRSHGRGVSVPINSKHSMNIEIKPIAPSATELKTRVPKSINKLDTTRSEYPSSSASLRGFGGSAPLNHTLSVVYNEELVPLQTVIKDLKNDIDMLAAQQMLLQERMEPKRIRPFNKKCACARTLRKNSKFNTGRIQHDDFLS